MAAPLFQRFFGELKRRKVFRAAGAYLVMGWVAIEVSETVAPLMGLPGWVPRLVLFLVILGFPLAVGLAWAVDLTEAGVQRTSTAPGEEGGAVQPPGPATRWAARALVGTGILAAVLVGGWYLVGARGSHPVVDHSIAVLPFETLGAQESSAFTEGVQVGILTRLATVSDLDVISRTSVMGYRAAAVPVRQIATELGVGWILRGEVQEQPDRVLVNVRLVNAREDRTVWAEAYEEGLTAENVFQIQSRIATAIIEELEARLTVGEERRLVRAPTGSIDAYRLYVQGRSLLDDRTADGMRRSLDYFQRAIAEDSTFALAWVGLADAFVLLHDYGFEDETETLPAAEAAVSRALELDPRSAEAHASLGLLYGTRGRGDASIRELERAVELRPSYAEAHNWLAWANLVRGDADEALDRARRAVALDPLAAEPAGNLAWAYLAHGRTGDALAESRHLQELAPANPDGRLLEGVALYEEGRADEAQAVLEGVVVPWAEPGPRLTLALARIATGEVDQARAMQAELEAASDYYAVGVIHAALGDTDQAFAAFDRVEDWDDYWPTLATLYLYRDALADVRADPRFPAILDRLD